MLIDIKNASDEALKEMLSRLREQRKASYQMKRKSTRKTEKTPDFLKSLDEETAQKILNALLEGEKENATSSDAG